MLFIIIITCTITLNLAIIAVSRILPGERWQVLFSVPIEKITPNSWRAFNMTWYGFITATSLTAALFLYLVMTSSAGITPLYAAIPALLVLALAVPSSSMIARIAEGKKHTFSVGAAVFTAFISSPVLLVLIEKVSSNSGTKFSALKVFASFCIAYLLGEGLGRLACISFGCCYGRPLSSLSPFWRKKMRPFAVKFLGKTKKISYASDMENVPVIPVQSMTAILYVNLAAAGMLLFYSGHFRSAFIIPFMISQAWRFFSEFLRADHRGSGTLSVYQKMSIAMLFLSPLVVFFPDAHGIPFLAGAFTMLWSPVWFFAGFCMWTLIFIRMGKSTVTGSTLTIYVHHDRI